MSDDWNAKVGGEMTGVLYKILEESESQNLRADPDGTVNLGPGTVPTPSRQHTQGTTVQDAKLDRHIANGPTGANGCTCYGIVVRQPGRSQEPSSDAQRLR